MVIEGQERAGGKVTIYIKDELFKGVKLVKNAQDCIVWLKLVKIYFGLELILCTKTPLYMHSMT